MTSYIQQAINDGLISFDNSKRINYLIQNKSYSYTDPEEKVRCTALVELIYEYGYKSENIDFEVRAKQGSSGKTSADIVIYFPNEIPKKPFLVIELKAAGSKDKEDDVRKQARSYARSEEISTQYFAYKIGDNPFKAFKINGKDTEIKIPYEYNKNTIYAYVVEGQPTDEKTAHYINIERSTPHDLKRIFSLCHNIIWQSGEKNKQKSLDEFNKILFLKMYDEIEREKNEIHLEKYLFQTNVLETKNQLKDRIEKVFQEATKNRKVDTLLKPIDLDATQIYDIIEQLQKWSLLATDKDPKGLAFETFVENYMKGDFGQYFTPRNIVEFMVNISPVAWDSNFNSSSKFLDPCCGSGSFITQVISSFKQRYKNVSNQLKFTNESVFGSEISADISVSAKINFALHDNGHDNVKTANGLNLKHFEWGSTPFDLILTNPPFGGEPVENKSKETSKDANNLSRFYDYEEFEITRKRFDEIDIIRKKVADVIKHSDSIRPEYIFLELFAKALKEGGIAQIVVPDGLLTNSSIQDVRDFMLEKFKLLAVISLPQYAFSHYGAGVKASILVLKKLSNTKTLQIKTTKRKYLEISVKQHENQLLNLEAEKANLANTYEHISKINDEFAEQKRVIIESIPQNDGAKKHLQMLEKETKEKIKTITETANFKDWKKEQENEINQKIADLKEIIYIMAQADFTKFEPDLQHPIFMAIAEQIGYDATGRETNQNDLTDITPELIKFLQAEQKGQEKAFL